MMDKDFSIKITEKNTPSLNQAVKKQVKVWKIDLVDFPWYKNVTF